MLFGFLPHIYIFLQGCESPEDSEEWTFLFTEAVGFHMFSSDAMRNSSRSKSGHGYLEWMQAATQGSEVHDELFIPRKFRNGK